MQDDLREVRNALFVGLLVWLLAAGVARCDYVAAVGASWCKPCQEMRPIENKLRNEKYDIRYIDVDKNPSWKRLCRLVPTFIYVVEWNGGNYEVARIEGKCSEQRLRQFCHAPIAAHALTATGNAFERFGAWIGGRR